MRVVEILHFAKDANRIWVNIYIIINKIIRI